MCTVSQVIRPKSLVISAAVSPDRLLKLGIESPMPNRFCFDVFWLHNIECAFILSFIWRVSCQFTVLDV